jgi:hypothetical protein
MSMHKRWPFLITPDEARDFAETEARVTSLVGGKPSIVPFATSGTWITGTD